MKDYRMLFFTISAGKLVQQLPGCSDFIGNEVSDYNGFRGGSRICPQTDPAERAGLSFVPLCALCG